jgi:hypothetical protein
MMSKPAKVLSVFAQRAFWRRPDEEIAAQYWHYLKQAFASRHRARLLGKSSEEIDATLRHLVLSGEVLNIALAREEKVLKLIAAGELGRAGAMIREVWGPRGHAIIEEANADEAMTRRRWQAKLSQKAAAARAEADVNKLRLYIEETVVARPKISIGDLWLALKGQIGRGVIVAVTGAAIEWRDGAGQTQRTTRGAIKQLLKRAKKRGSPSGL